VVEGGGLENRRRESVRGFESLPLRQAWLALTLCLACGVASGWSERAHAQEVARPRVEPALARALADPEVAGAALRTQLRGGRGARARAGELRVIVEPPAGRGVDDLPLTRMRALGARVDGTSRSRVRITGTPEVIARVAELGEIGAMRFPLVPIPVAGSGAIVSQSTDLVRASVLQDVGFTGAGVDVAVLDIGFMELAEARAAGEIPQNAIAVDLVGAGMETLSAHGTAVAEQLADIAPGARLHLILFDDDVDFENAVDYVHANGIRIASLSVNWFGTSYYDDTGPISTLVNDSHDDHGVFWVVGGGNWAFRHWRGAWLDEDADGWISFAPNDEQLGLIAELAQICIVLNWNQYAPGYTGTPTDLDLYVRTAAGAVVATSSERQTPGSSPVEQACFARQAAEEPYHVRVRRFSGPTAGLDLTIVSADAAIEVAKRVAARSLVDPAVAHGAFAVGAINHPYWNNAAPPIEGFSSQGPTNDGRPKPELVAPDRTSSLTYPSALGTSFAAPVVAGAAALLLDQSALLSHLQLRSMLIAAADDVGPVGHDAAFGWGKLVAPFVPAGPDSDADGVPDVFDVCPFTADPTQRDANDDDIGDACQCGDLSGDGRVNAIDADRIQLWLASPASPPMGLPRCNVRGAAAPSGTDCRIDDWAVVMRALAGRAPGVQQVCAPALPP
jgi:subtilisin family serine protease